MARAAAKTKVKAKKTKVKVVKSKVKAKKTKKNKDISSKGTQTRIDIVKDIAKELGTTSTFVNEYEEARLAVIKKYLNADGEISFGGIKFIKEKKPATPARMMKSPLPLLDGQQFKIPAKKKRNTVKVRLLKPVKELVEA